MLQKIILYNLFTFVISYSMSNINSINKYKPIMSIQEFEPSKIINNLAKSSANLDIWNINEFIYNINHISGITLIKENNQINGIVSIDDNIVDNLISLNNLHYTETGISQFSDKVIDLIVKNDILYDIIQTPDMPINQIQNLLSIGMNIVVIYFIFSILSSLLQRFKSGGMIIPIKDNKLINADEISTRFDDVAGCDEVKYELQEIVDFLKNPDKYYQAGAKIPKGVLLEGPPGTGKTLLARAVAGEAGVSFISVSGSEFVQMFVGVGAARVRELFENAKKNSPCVIFIDEIDAIGRKRGDLSIGGNNEEREQTLNQLLTNMDGFTHSDSITVIAATNRIDILDKALTRSGRFDRKVRVGFPNLNGRKKILQVHLKNKQVDPETDFEEISLLTSGFSGADIENMANEAVIIALRDNVTIINTNYLVKAYEKLTIGLPYNDNEVNREKDKLVAYHESGHAIIAELFKEFFNVRKVTINANTNGVGGYTLITVKEQYIQYPTKKFLLANMIVTMGGRAGEILLYSYNKNDMYETDKIFTNIKNLDITTGASQDLKQLDMLARNYIEIFGYINNYPYENKSDSGIIQVPTSPYINLSDKTLEQIDYAVNKLGKWAITSAINILKQNQHILNELSEKLIEEREITEKYLENLNITYF